MHLLTNLVEKICDPLSFPRYGLDNTIIRSVKVWTAIVCLLII